MKGTPARIISSLLTFYVSVLEFGAQKTLTDIQVQSPNPVEVVAPLLCGGL